MFNESKEIRELIDKLNEYTKYYDLGTPKISDKEYDELYFKLKEMEKNTGIVYPDSPTQSISYQVYDKLVKTPHIGKPMLSLDKSKDVKDIEKFVKGNDWCAMFKLDGLTVRLTYDEGKLIRAETRGDGYKGEYILHNALVVPSIPKEIPNKEFTVIEGEVIMDYDTFNTKFGKGHPRNLAAGSIRLLNSKECASRGVTFVAWDLVQGCEDIDFFMWRLEKLDEWGFITVPRVGDAETVSDAIEILDNDSHRNIYPIDGYVFRFESQKLYNELGNTDHHFRGAMAFKFYDDEYETELLDIIYDVSRNGVLTPVAVFKPIEIDGTIVEKCSLFNLSILEEKLGKPYKGQKIWVVKRNQIIPYIERSEKID